MIFNMRAAMVEGTDVIPGLGEVTNRVPAADRLSWAGTMCVLPENMEMICFTDSNGGEAFLVIDRNARINVTGGN